MWGAGRFPVRPFRPLKLSPRGIITPLHTEYLTTLQIIFLVPFSNPSFLLTPKGTNKRVLVAIATKKYNYFLVNFLTISRQLNNVLTNNV